MKEEKKNDPAFVNGQFTKVNLEFFIYSKDANKFSEYLKEISSEVVRKYQVKGKRDE